MWSSTSFFRPFCPPVHRRFVSQLHSAGWRYLTIWAPIILIISADSQCRLLDIVHADQKLYLVFEFLDVDLKRYIETSRPLKMDIVKVCYVALFSSHILNCDQTQFIFYFGTIT